MTRTIIVCSVVLACAAVVGALGQSLGLGFASNSNIEAYGQSNVYCRIEKSINLFDWEPCGSMRHVYTTPIAVPFDTSAGLTFFRGDTMPTNWASLNNSTPDSCAEHDNLNILLIGSVLGFSITATHPSYTPSNYLCDANFNNCSSGTNVDYQFPDPQTWHTSFASHWANAYRQGWFWRPQGMDYALNGYWLAGATNIHELDIGKNIPGTSEWPGFLTIYSDGYIRVIPFPPVGQPSVCMGSSVLVGPAEPSERPFADIASVDLRSTNLTLFVTYRSGGTATIDFSTVSRTSAILRVSVDYPTEEPFCTVRSMFVSNGNSDCDTVIWQDGLTVTTNAVLDFQGGSGTNWLFCRQHHSSQRDSAPDIRISF